MDTAMKDNLKMSSVLVVDDDPECLEFAELVLTPDYTVRTAGSIEQCREAMQSYRPDLLVLDVMMNHLSDGLDFTRELRESDATRDIPVIMMTSVNRVYNYREQVPPDYFPHNRWLDKPVKPAVLLDAVNRLLTASSVETGSP